MDFLSEVDEKLDLPPGEKAQVMRELESHYGERRRSLLGHQGLRIGGNSQ